MSTFRRRRNLRARLLLAVALLALAAGLGAEWFVGGDHDGTETTATIGVTGAIQQVRRLTDALYRPFAYLEPYSVEHSGTLTLVGPDARVRAYFSPPHRAATLATSVYQVVNQG